MLAPQRLDCECLVCRLSFEKIIFFLNSWPNVRSTQRAVLQKLKLFYSGYFDGKIDLLVCLAGKTKYICWEPF